MKLISIVSPCFNEEGNIHELYIRMRAVMCGFPQYRYEHIFIDNNSTDRTVDILKDIASKDPNVKIIVNSRNFGYVRSPVHAIYQATGDAVALLPSDLQDPPEVIDKMILAWESGSPIVIGIKNTSEESRLMYACRTAYYRIMAKLVEIEYFQHFTGFGLYDRKVIDILKTQFYEPYPHFKGMIAEVGFTPFRIAYNQKRRVRGSSSFRFYALYDFAMLSITGLSKVPLRIFTFAGFVLSVTSMIVALVYLVRKLLSWDTFSVGIAPLITGIFFFMSVLMIGLGILGEYIGAIHTIVQNRPLVVEKERINFSESERDNRVLQDDARE
jgi:glycosyltransferase involved in cell wall biosynthesis